MKEAFLERNPDAGNMYEAVVACKGFLERNPKWRTWQEEEDSREETGKKRSRPSGTKAAKQKEQDKKVIQGFLSGSSVDGTAIETQRQKHHKKTEAFMVNVAGSLASFASAFSQQMEQANRLALLSHFSPTKRAKLAEEMFKSAAVTPVTSEINTGSGGSSVESQLSGTTPEQQKIVEVEVEDEVEDSVEEEEAVVVDKPDNEVVVDSDSDHSSTCDSPQPRTRPTRKVLPSRRLRSRVPVVP